MRLPRAFLDRPIAHRGFHDLAARRPENSRAAFRAAIEAGYGIELDVQPSADGVTMVFHDYDLERLTGKPGPIRTRPADELGGFALLGGDEGVPTLTEVLDLVAGQVPLLIEIKDQDGALGSAVGDLEEAVALDLDGYDGPAALMSFNPHSVARLADAAPGRPRGLVTEAFDGDDWPIPPERRSELAGIPDYDRVGASFISHHHKDLARSRVAELKAAGAHILCWTIRSEAEARAALRVAHNITFEGYRPRT